MIEKYLSDRTKDMESAKNGILRDLQMKSVVNPVEDLPLDKQHIYYAHYLYYVFIAYEGDQTRCCRVSAIGGEFVLKTYMHPKIKGFRYPANFEKDAYQNLHGVIKYIFKKREVKMAKSAIDEMMTDLPNLVDQINFYNLRK